MTTVYFIRHAESDTSVREGRIRPLTAKGLADRRLVTEYLSDKHIGAVLSSPFKRAVDTVAPFAESAGLRVITDEDFRERKSDGDWVRETDFFPFMERQWADFSYTLSDGECLAAVRNRNIAALNRALAAYEGQNIVIGTHGTALSTIINYYDARYGYKEMHAMLGIMPWVVRMTFDENTCAGIAKIDLFTPDGARDYGCCEVETAPLGTLKAYRFVVIFARFRDRWLYCRAKTRDVYETAGGHIEPGETPPDAAKRELYEETGAAAFDITPAFDYSVRFPSSWANGQVFFAKITELGAMPDFEMAETRLFDAIPDGMRFPRILPILYRAMQGWLNQNQAASAGELWDIYDHDRNPKGRTHRRGDPLNEGDYHIVVHVWQQNGAGEFLITKRAPNKGDPHMWECTAGSAVTGDDSLTAALREVKEETGLTLRPENGRRVLTVTLTSEGRIADIWLFRQDFDLRDVVLQERETVDARYASADEIRAMIARGEFIPYRYLDYLLDAAAF